MGVEGVVIILGVMFWGWIIYSIVSDPKKRKKFWDEPQGGDGG